MRSPEFLDPEAFIAANREALEAVPKVITAVNGVSGHHTDVRPQVERASDPPADSRLIEVVAALEAKGADIQLVMEMAAELAQSRKDARQGLATADQSKKTKHQYDELVILLNQSLQDRDQSQKAARLFIDRAEEVL